MNRESLVARLRKLENLPIPDNCCRRRKGWTAYFFTPERAVQVRQLLEDNGFVLMPLKKGQLDRSIVFSKRPFLWLHNGVDYNFRILEFEISKDVFQFQI